MDSFYKVPSRIRNIPRWEEHCRKIHARAQELIEGKISLFHSVVEINKLAVWTLSTDDPELAVFGKALHASVGLPTGPERQYWSKAALEKVAPQIEAWESQWRPLILAAAARLIVKFRWALGARQRRRSTGHVV